MKLSNKVALITGSGSGMGRASAMLFAQEGARISVVDTDKKGGEQTAELIKQKDGNAVFIQADVSKADDADKMIKTTVDNFGKLDILFNNAGIPMPFTSLEEVTEDLWSRIIDVNVKGIFLGCKYAIPLMKKQGGGVIINTASIGGVRPRPGFIVYDASKAAAIMLTRGLAIELAPYKIRVNCINPVAADTPMLAKFIHERGREYEKYEEERKRFIDTIPIGRLAQPEDVAYAAIILIAKSIIY